MVEVSAMHKGARISAQKARLLIDLIRGHEAQHALNVLKFSNKKAASMVRKVLLSALANAENNEGLDLKDLRVVKAYVNEGVTMKRVNPRSKGRADRIFKRSCHITVKVAEK
ncbi:MAG: 50S ribosomal protein L22 [Endozoicomonadaceae bacterium]|nr:50S ribosomal protein L22 [Endozoicomonadaceae bacterium]